MRHVIPGNKNVSKHFEFPKLASPVSGTLSEVLDNDTTTRNKQGRLSSTSRQRVSTGTHRCGGGGWMSRLQDDVRRRPSASRGKTSHNALRVWRHSSIMGVC